MGCEGYVPTSGEIVFEGSRINALRLFERARLGITLCWQEPARLEGISVENYLTLGRQPVDGATYLRKVGLAPDQYLLRNIDKTLSGGQRKRIELASVLALRPKLALLDEPDSGIDLLSLGEIAEVIHSFKDIGASSLLITHREEIVRIADRASQLCGGKIILTATPAEVAELMPDLSEISQVLQRMGTDAAVLTDSGVAHVVASGLELLSHREIPGVAIRSEREADGLSTQITVKQHARIETPVHLCRRE